jgi:uncharacterized protein
MAESRTDEHPESGANAGVPGGRPDDAIEDEARRWLTALEVETGPLALFDAHTHFGRNDPDGYRQEPHSLVARMENAGARAIAIPMHEPLGYSAANDEGRGIEAGSDGRIVHFCRVDPHDGALDEAQRCLDLGAHGIKLHPRSEQFSMGEPVVGHLAALAEERGVPILVHAGRGIPSLGHETLELARRYSGARFILAHAAVSDLAWLWRVMPANPNVFIDTSWFFPADLVFLFSHVPPGQIVWGSDSPYGLPLHAAAFQLRFGVLAGLDGDKMRAIAGETIGKIVDREETPDLGPAPGPPPRVLDPTLERAVAYIGAAGARIAAGGPASEPISLAKLVRDPDGPEAETSMAVLRLLDLAEKHSARCRDRAGLYPGERFLVAAAAVARTPGFALPLG